jgi:O-antigen ligase
LIIKDILELFVKTKIKIKMKKFIEKLVLDLAIFLPLHGAITVFLPSPFRFWKEVVLVLLIVSFLVFEFKNFRSRKIKKFSRPEIWSLLFIFWTTILTVLNFNSYTVIATRYLITGFLTFFVFSRILQNFTKEERKELFQKFAKYFCISVAISVLVSIWAQYLGGFEILKSFYSVTISSWVPGQTIPLFHEIAGIARFQGASSGPIEFSHLVLVALFFTTFLRISKSVKLLLAAFFIFGILGSFSRAAILSALLGIIIWIIQNFQISKKIVLSSFVILFLNSVLLFLNPTFQTKFVERVGTSEHFTRPIEVFKKALGTSFVEKLSSIGPAARARNLKTKDDDQAPIAENVFIDIFAQTGAIGLLLVLAFFIAYFRLLNPAFYAFFFPAILTMNMATIFDMTPISIAFFIVFAFGEE